MLLARHFGCGIFGYELLLWPMWNYNEIKTDKNKEHTDLRGKPYGKNHGEKRSKIHYRNLTITKGS